MFSRAIGVFCFLAFASFALGAQKPRGECQRSWGTSLLARKILEIHHHKGTFEELLPVAHDSFAEEFPEVYGRIMRLFYDRPSYLIGVNRGAPPYPGMLLRDVFLNIHQFAETISTDLGHIAKDVPRSHYMREILDTYIKQFRIRRPGFLDQSVYQPDNRRQFNLITGYGKNLICSVWSELRLAMRIGNLSRVSVNVRGMIADGFLHDDPLFRDFMGQEIDHLWFPTGKNGLPYAVALGEVKVFDTPFSRSYHNLDHVYEQLERLLHVASLVGPQVGQPPQLYYFFVGGITPEQIAVMQRRTSEFNARIARDDRSKRGVVELVVYGDYTALGQGVPAVSQ